MFFIFVHLYCSFHFTSSNYYHFWAMNISGYHLEVNQKVAWTQKYVYLPHISFTLYPEGDLLLFEIDFPSRRPIKELQVDPNAVKLIT